MAGTLKDEVMVTTIKEWASITGYTDDQILKWSVARLRDELQQAQGTVGAYWRVFLRELEKNLIKAFKNEFSDPESGITEVYLMSWPEALDNPNSSAAQAELDDVADQIEVVIS